MSRFQMRLPARLKYVAVHAHWPAGITATDVIRNIIARIASGTITTSYERNDETFAVNNIDPATLERAKQNVAAEGRSLGEVVRAELEIEVSKVAGRSAA